MRATGTDYLRQLQALLPVGGAWTREPGAVLTELLDGKAVELARVHNRLVDLVDEADPQTTLELLPDWERVVGLPDCCLGIADTIDARRALVLGRLTARGGQSDAYFRSICAAAGWTIETADYSHFVAGEAEAGDMLLEGDGEEFEAGGSIAGDSLGLFDWWHAWRVSGDPSESTWFEADASVAGDAIDWSDNPVVRCLIERFKPAHTRAVYAWTPRDDATLFPAEVTVTDYDFVAGDGEAGMPLGYRRTVTFRHDADPLVSIE